MNRCRSRQRIIQRDSAVLLNVPNPGHRTAAFVLVFGAGRKKQLVRAVQQRTLHFEFCSDSVHALQSALRAEGRKIRKKNDSRAIEEGRNLRGGSEPAIFNEIAVLCATHCAKCNPNKNDKFLRERTSHSAYHLLVVCVKDLPKGSRFAKRDQNVPNSWSILY